MKFLADMGISLTTVLWLRNKGFDAIHLRELGLQRLSDSEIIMKAKSEDRIILTCDLDFGAIMSASKEPLPSIITFRLVDERPTNINKNLDIVLKDSKNALIHGAIITAEENRHRIRHLPI